MKKLLFFAALIAAGNVSGRELVANLSCASFSTPENKTYVETYVSIMGNSVAYAKKPNGKFQASVDILLTFTNNDSIQSALRYVLNSPEIDDTTKTENFLDLQRFPLPAGFYYLSGSFTDLNRKPLKTLQNRRSVSVDIDKDSVSLSHIELLETYYASKSQTALTKSNYELVPYVSSFYPPNLSQLSFYGEIYNTTKAFKPEEKFVLLYYIESVVTGSKMSGFSTFMKLKPEPVNPLLLSFNITSLPSGSYYLVFEVRNATNQLMAMRKTSFERFNPGVTYKLDDIAALDISNSFVSKVTNGDSLVEMIRCLRPISSANEIDFAENRIKAGDIKLMQQYIYNFWLSRNEPNPEGAWLQYNVQVQKVERTFGTQITRGYATDRGRVYLQYGPPDQMIPSQNEPSAYPYEVWQYYTIRGNTNAPTYSDQNMGQQTNKKFVFADFDLATNNYQLIHSDARGETRDDNWKLRLVKRNNSTRSLDQQDGNPQYGGRSEDIFINPH
jgi:GWxTD domain-containing protein